MKKRKCGNCGKPIPPETEHFERDDDLYCVECVTVHPYTSYIYYLNGEYIGISEEGSDHVRHIEAYEDDYEEDAG